MANRKRKTNPLPVLWEVVQLQGQSVPVVNHSKGVIALLEEYAVFDEGEVINKELTFDVPDSITETPSVIGMGGIMWDVYNVSVPEPFENKNYKHYKLGVLVSRREEQFNIGSGDDLRFLGTDVSNSPDSTGGFSLDGLSKLLDTLHKNSFATPTMSKTAEAMRQFVDNIAWPSQAFNQMGQQMISGFVDGFDDRMKKIKEEAEERLAEVRANHERAAEIDLEITNQYFSVQNRQEQYCYFVVTSDYTVITFESKEHLNCFLVEHLDNQAYGIILAHSFAEWFGSSTKARLYDIIKAIENYKRGAKC